LQREVEMTAGTHVDGWGKAPSTRYRVVDLPASAVVRIGGPAVAVDPADPVPTSLIACAAPAGATSFLKPTSESAPQAGSGVAPAVVEEKSAN
jgi:hypothetical protein